MPVYDRTNIPASVGRGILDPELEAWLPKGPTLGAAVSIPQGRHDHAVLGEGPWPEIGAVDTLVLPGPHGSLAVRRHTPTSPTSAPSGALVCVHGGGFTYGTLDEFEVPMRLIAERAGIVTYARAGRSSPCTCRSSRKPPSRATRCRGAKTGPGSCRPAADDPRHERLRPAPRRGPRQRPEAGGRRERPHLRAPSRHDPRVPPIHAPLRRLPPSDNRTRRPHQSRAIDSQTVMTRSSGRPWRSRKTRAAFALSISNRSCSKRWPSSTLTQEHPTRVVERQLRGDVLHELGRLASERAVGDRNPGDTRAHGSHAIQHAPDAGGRRHGKPTAR